MNPGQPPQAQQKSVPSVSNQLNIPSEYRTKVVNLLRTTMEQCGHHMVNQAADLERTIFDRAATYNDYQNFIKMFCNKLQEGTQSNRDPGRQIRPNVPIQSMNRVQAGHQSTYVQQNQHFSPMDGRLNTPQSVRGQQMAPQRARPLINIQPRPMPSGSTPTSSIPRTPPQRNATQSFIHSQDSCRQQQPQSVHASLSNQSSVTPTCQRPVGQVNQQSLMTSRPAQGDSMEAEKATIYQECTSMIPTIRSFLNQYIKRQIHGVNDTIVTRSRAVVDHFERRGVIQLTPLMRVRHFLEQSLMPLMASYGIGLERAHDPLTQLQAAYVTLLQLSTPQHGPQSASSVPSVETTTPPKPTSIDQQPQSSSTVSDSIENQSICLAERKFDISGFRASVAKLRKRPADDQELVKDKVRDDLLKRGMKDFDFLKRTISFYSQRREQSEKPKEEQSPFPKIDIDRESILHALNKELEIAKTFNGLAKLDLVSYPICPLSDCILRCRLDPRSFKKWIPAFEINLRLDENGYKKYHAYCSFENCSNVNQAGIMALREKLESLTEPVSLTELLDYILKE
ncbi:hypothetical protein ACOME3_000917 [Neoechinorhynchus agilis]